MREGVRKKEREIEEKGESSRALRQVVTRQSDRESFIPAIPSPRRSSRFYQGPLTIGQEKDWRARSEATREELENTRPLI